MKKGFTLIELLAVIIIVAIISLVAIPVISNVVNNTKVSALKSSANGLLEASNLYRAQYGNSKTIRFDIEDNKITSNDTDKLLSYNGSVKKGTVIIDNKGRIVVCVTDGKNSAYKNYNEKGITTNSEKTCNIKEGSSIVYLGNEATLSELSNQELTDQLTALQEKVKALESSKANQNDLEIIGTIANSSTLDKAWPIGSIYMTMTESTVEDVHNKLGGTWEKIESGRMLQSTSSNSGSKGGQSSVSYTPSGLVSKPTGTFTGTKATLSHSGGAVGSHTLTTNEIPAHTHYIVVAPSTASKTYSTAVDVGGGFVASGVAAVYSGIQYRHPISNSNFYDGGSGGAHNHSFTQPTAHTYTPAGSVTISQPSFTGTSSTINTMSPYITVYMYKRVS